jgi:hypothetical protein
VAEALLLFFFPLFYYLLHYSSFAFQEVWLWKF